MKSSRAGIVYWTQSITEDIQKTATEADNTAERFCRLIDFIVFIGWIGIVILWLYIAYGLLFLYADFKIERKENNGFQWFFVPMFAFNIWFFI